MLTSPSISLTLSSVTFLRSLNCPSKLSSRVLVVSGLEVSKAVILLRFTSFLFWINMIFYSRFWWSVSLSCFSLTSRTLMESLKPFLKSAIAFAFASIFSTNVLLDSSADFCLSDSTFLTCSAYIFKDSCMLINPWELFLVSLSTLMIIHLRSSALSLTPTTFPLKSVSMLNTFLNRLRMICISNGHWFLKTF